MDSQTSSSAISLSQSAPQIGEESRGSSVSTEMREEYEDLLRYAVVVPVGKDAKKASAREQRHASGATAVAAGVAGDPSVDFRAQPESARVRVPQPYPSPLHPEGET